MKFHLAAVLATALLAGLSTSAQADVVSSFAFGGSLGDGSLISGDLSIDTTTGLIVGSTVATTGLQAHSFSLVVFQESGGYVPTAYAVNLETAAHDFDFNFDIDGSSLVDFTGADVPTGGVYDLIGGFSTDGGNIINGKLTADLGGTVPEPSSIALLVAAACAAAVGMKRRRPAASAAA